MADFSATGWNWENDELRILNPANCANSQVLIYLTQQEAVDFEVGTVGGWYDSTSVEYQGNTSFDIGSGFMTRLSSTGVKFQYSGQVYTEAFSIDCAGKVYVIIPNALPRETSMSEISASGWNWENDELRVLDSSNCSNSKVLFWLTEEEAKEFEVGTVAGWYDSTTVEYCGDLTIQPGEGFMTRLSSTDVKVNFPTSITISE